jgi:hypothetical protein
MVSFDSLIFLGGMNSSTLYSYLHKVENRFSGNIYIVSRRVASNVRRYGNTILITRGMSSIALSKIDSIMHMQAIPFFFL